MMRRKRKDKEQQKEHKSAFTDESTQEFNMIKINGAAPEYLVIKIIFYHITRIGFRPSIKERKNYTRYVYAIGNPKFQTR